MKLQRKVSPIFGRIPLLVGVLWTLSLASPLSAAVESDVVGYTTITTQPGFNMQGVVFQGLNGRETIALDELMSGDFQVEDQVQVYDVATSGYTIYTYRGPEYGWMAGQRPSSAVPVKAGDSFWLKTQGSVKASFAGSVRKGNFRYESVVGTQMVSVNFPVEFALNDESGMVKWANVQDGDEIQVYDGNGYTIYRYSQFVGKWVEGQNLADVRIPVGASIWMKCKSAGTVLEIVNPLQ